MVEAALWWLCFLGIGLAALPITLAAFRFLPDRGYGLARPLGLLIFAYLFWTLGIARVIPNSQAGAIIVLALLLAISAEVLYHRRESLAEFFKGNWKIVLTTELVFLAVFGVWTYIRSLTPAVVHTEQPMDFALLNGILHAQSFPPQDPWFAGESISYYYFGYLMSAGVTQATGFASSIAYNLALVSFAAMSAAAIFSVVFNIVAGIRSSASVLLPVVAGIAGVVLLLFMGNLVGALEFFDANEIGPAGFWSIVSIDGLDGRAPSGTWYPNEFWWWFRDTRVINSSVGSGVFSGIDVDFTITEFPFFSFLLGDLHPHAMSIPFVVLVIGLAYNTLNAPTHRDVGWLRRHPLEFILAAIVIGALGFLNSWDAPTFLALFLAALLLRAFHARAGGSAVDFGRVGALMITLVVATMLFYLPFYLFFDSQFAGITLVRFQSTNPVHLFLALGPVLALGLSFVGALVWDDFRSPVAAWLRDQATDLIRRTRAGLGMALGDQAGSTEWARECPTSATRFYQSSVFWAVAISLLPFAIWASVELGLTIAGARTGLLEGERSFQEGLLAIGSRFGRLLPGFLVVSLLLALLFRKSSREGVASAPLQFALLLLAFAFILLLGAELFHIEDQFGVTADRMNTVFKFYYQAWILLAISGAVALYYWVSRIRRSGWFGRVGNGVLLSFLGLILVAGFVYVPSSTYSRARDFHGDATLDGLTLVKVQAPAAHAAIVWLNENADGESVLMEAVELDGSGQPQGSYNPEAAGFAQRTGIPTVLGWGGHERQWRGKPFDSITERGRDVDTFYRTEDPETAGLILDQYEVSHVIVGDEERRIYGSEVQEKLASFLDIVFENEVVVIYQRRSAS